MSTDQSSAPTVYDTNNLNQSQFQQMAQLLAKQIGSNNSGYSITGDNAQSLLQAAMAINGTQITPAVSTPSNSTAGAPVQSSGFWSELLDAASASGGASSVAAGPAEQISATGNSSFAKNAGGSFPNTAQQYGDSAKAAEKITSPFATWIAEHAGNYGLIIAGVILAISALIISQKNTVIKVASTAAKVAAE